MKPKTSPVSAKKTFSLGGHVSLTVLVVALLLFIAACVYFVNAVVITNHDDQVYRSTALSTAQQTTFNDSLLKQAQAFSANANNTTLPASRINPF